MVRRSILVIGGIVLLFCSACTSGNPPEQAATQAGTEPAPATAAVGIVPLEAYRETTFSISDTRTGASMIQWLVNNVPVPGANTAQFIWPELRKGDRVRVRAVTGGMEVLSNEVTIRNIRPVVAKAEILPRVPKAQDGLKASAIGSDRDNDPVTFNYEWLKNGEPAGIGETLDGPFLREDMISLKVTPSDGEEEGETVTITTKIYNSPPDPSSGAERFENGLYSVRIFAKDPDGDPVSFSLKKAPEGMAIDPASGLITWKVAEKDIGRHPVSILVSDSKGGGVLYNFDVTFELKR